MSWGCFDVVRCKKCGYEYRVELDTISSNIATPTICPKCKSDGEIIGSNSMLNAMNKQRELFKKRKKRISL